MENELKQWAKEMKLEIGFLPNSKVKINSKASVERGVYPMLNTLEAFIAYFEKEVMRRVYIRTDIYNVRFEKETGNEKQTTNNA